MPDKNSFISERCQDTAYAIGTQLKEDGLLLPGKTNLTVQRSVRGSVIRLWRLKPEILGCEDCETCNDHH